MSDITSSECTNVDQIIVDSLVENCNKILLDAASESEMFFTSKHKNKNVKKVKKKTGSIGIILSSVKSILKLGIQVGELNQLKIELISFVLVKHTRRRLINSIMLIETIFSKLRNLKTNDPKSYWSLIRPLIKIGL